MKYLKLECKDNMVGDYIDITADQNDQFTIGINHPWDGDSDTGFGREMYHSFTKEQAEQLFEYLKINLQIR